MYSEAQLHVGELHHRVLIGDPMRDDDLDTRVFEIKAKAARDIMEVSIGYLSGLVSEHEKKSAENMAKVEPKFTPEELLASRAALTEHGRVVSDPLKEILSDKREYLRRNQPTWTDLITMRNRDREFPRKSNPPPAPKKRTASAAVGRAPDKKPRRDNRASERTMNFDQWTQRKEKPRR